MYALIANTTAALVFVHLPKGALVLSSFTSHFKVQNRWRRRRAKQTRISFIEKEMDSLFNTASPFVNPNYNNTKDGARDAEPKHKG